MQQVFVYPTDTAYAIGGDALDLQVYQRISKIKKRPSTKPFPWIATSYAMAEKYCIFSPAAKKLAKKYWPGPLTLVLPLRKKYVGKMMALRSIDFVHSLGCLTPVKFRDMENRVVAFSTIRCFVVCYTHEIESRNKEICTRNLR